MMLRVYRPVDVLLLACLLVGLSMFSGCASSDDTREGATHDVADAAAHDSAGAVADTAAGGESGVAADTAARGETPGVVSDLTGAPAGTRPQRAEGIDLAACIRVMGDGIRPPSAACPAFLVETLREAMASCREAGGTLAPAQDPAFWTLDVNADGRREFAFDLEQIVGCEGAWSLFSCGSLGCPITILEGRKGGWAGIAAIAANDPESIEVLGSATGGSYHDLRVGCAGDPDCVEQSYYMWNGQTYEIGYLDVRGFRVDVADSIHGLRGLTGETPVLATPQPGGKPVGHYGADTDVAIIGTAHGLDYYYVSPCNACDSGFVPVLAVRTH